MSLLVDLTGPRGAFAAGKVEDALAAVESMLVNAPDHHELLTLHAELLIELDREEAGLRACDRLLASNPADGHAHYLRSMVLSNLRRYDEGAAEAKRAIATDPGDAKYHYLLGVAMMGQGNLPLARAALEEAVRFKPDVPSYRERLAQLMFDYSPPIAQALLERLVADEPQRAAELNDLGVLFERRGDRASAITLYQRALAAGPGLTVAKNNLERAEALQPAAVHYLALVLFFALFTVAPFGGAIALYRYGFSVLSGIACSVAALLTVAAVAVTRQSAKKRAAARLQPPECSFR